MEHLGSILVLFSFGMTALTAALAVHGAITKSNRSTLASGTAMRATAWINGALALVLSHAFVTHDFSNMYVASYSDSGMPFFYLLTAFWGGEKGALLFWVTSLSILAAIYAKKNKHDSTARFGWVNAILALSLLFFDILMVFASSPFKRFLTSGKPADGNGLNPLLQNPLMAIHPPLQLVGFVAYTVPFALAIGALIVGETDGQWVRDARRWQLFAWVTLTAGLIVGELWSYVELGWGGYWGWDPVENAALLPWLTGTAFLHTASVEERRGLFRRWNFILITLTFFLTIFATFLTRSQLIQSLHSFANSVLTPFFMYHMAILAILSISLIAWRWNSLKPIRKIDSLFSREAVVLVNVLLFLMATFVVLWGTLLPKITESSTVRAMMTRLSFSVASYTGGMPTEMTEALNVGAEWFNMVVGPIGILILGLTAIGPLLPFKVGPNKATKRQLAWSGAVTLSVALTIAVMFLAIRSNQFSTNTGIPTGEAMVIYLKSMSWAGPYALFAIWFGLWTIATLTVDWIDSIKRKKGMNPLKASIKLFVDNPKRFGGHLVHLGVALSFIGFAGEAGKLLQKNVVLEPMEGIVLGSQEVTFIGSFEHWQPAEGYASVKSAFLVRPIKASIRPKVLASVAKQVDAVSVEPGDGSEVVITLKSEQQAAALRAEIAASTSWANDYRLVRSDPENLEIQLAQAQLETLRVVPQSFNRRVRAAQALASELGNRISVTPGRGEPVINIKADDQTIFDALIAGMESTNHPWLASMIDTENPLKVKTLVQGVGSVLTPEIRFYLKSENPTTEVAIESSLLSDLYLAASPGQGSEAVNLTVMQNPLMASLWVGSLVLLVFGTLLVVPFRGSKKVSTVEEVGVAVEEQC